MNFADCCTNELEFRICTNCKNIQYKVYKPFEKMSAFFSTSANVCYFFRNVNIDVYYYYFRTFNTSVAATPPVARDRIAVAPVGRDSLSSLR